MLAYLTGLFVLVSSARSGAVPSTSTGTASQSTIATETQARVSAPVPTATIYPTNDKAVYITGQALTNVSLNAYLGVPFAAPRELFSYDSPK